MNQSDAYTLITFTAARMSSLELRNLACSVKTLDLCLSHDLRRARLGTPFLHRSKSFLISRLS